MRHMRGLEVWGICEAETGEEGAPVKLITNRRR